jgi:hypothetical protein
MHDEARDLALVVAVLAHTCAGAHQFDEQRSRAAAAAGKSGAGYKAHRGVTEALKSRPTWQLSAQRFGQQLRNPAGLTFIVAVLRQLYRSEAFA